MTTILIVDDESDVRESLQEYLEDEGFTVASVANGADALTFLERSDLPCMVILDLIMPVVTGNEVYDRMQGNPRLAAVPVVVSTSDPSRAPSGATVIKKPVDLRRLVGYVRAHCAEC